MPIASHGSKEGDKKHDRRPLAAEAQDSAVVQQEVLSRVQPDGDPLDQVVWHIGRAYYAYVGVLEQVLAETGLDEHLRPGMGHILFALFEQDGRSIKEIATRTQLSSSTLTGMLTRMEKAGIIARRRDDEDGRGVRLTRLGRSLEPRCRLVAERLGEILRAGMGANGVLHAKHLLRRLTETLRAEEQRGRRSLQVKEEDRT